jgi:hypothetical protein
VFDNRVLRRIFGPKSDEVTGGWRKLHNEELYSLYSSPSIIRRELVDNIKMDLRGIGWGGIDWINMATYRDQWRALVNTVVYLRVP